jgi:predicted DNA binding CopG/RHH family protein
MTDRLADLAHHYDTTDLCEQIEASEPATPTAAAAGTEPMDAFTVRLPSTILDALRQRAAAEKITTGQMIRRTLEAALSATIDDDKTIPVHKIRALIADAS